MNPNIILLAEDSKSSLENFATASGAIVGLLGVAISLYLLVWRDPRLRKAEQVERDVAQARAVVTQIADDGQSGTTICVRNLSVAPIFDVQVHASAPGLVAGATTELVAGQSITEYPNDLDNFPLLEPGESSKVLSTGFDPTRVSVETWFIDASGIRWIRKNSGQPLRAPLKTAKWRIWLAHKLTGEFG